LSVPKADATAENAVAFAFFQLGRILPDENSPHKLTKVAAAKTVLFYKPTPKDCVT